MPELVAGDFREGSIETEENRLESFFNKYQQFVNQTCNQELNASERLSNCVMGLCGEIAEVQLEGAFDHKELGDILWYAALGASVLEITFEQVINRVRSMPSIVPRDPSFRILTLELSIQAGLAADIVKKHLHQGHQLKSDALYEKITYIVYLVHSAASQSGTDLESIIQQNIDKLMARYPGGVFSVERSVNREG